jgi:hypothetical protein
MKHLNLTLNREVIFNGFESVFIGESESECLPKAAEYNEADFLIDLPNKLFFAADGEGISGVPNAEPVVAILSDSVLRLLDSKSFDPLLLRLRIIFDGLSEVAFTNFVDSFRGEQSSMDTSEDGSNQTST